MWKLYIRLYSENGNFNSIMLGKEHDILCLTTRSLLKQVHCIGYLPSLLFYVHNVEWHMPYIVLREPIHLSEDIFSLTVAYRGVNSCVRRMSGFLSATGAIFLQGVWGTHRPPAGAGQSPGRGFRGTKPPDICIQRDVVITRGGSATENILWVNVTN